MANENKTPVTAPAAAAWNPDQIFAMLADPARRHILLALAHGQALPASVLKGGVRLRLDATLKHLTTMRSAGLLVTRPDPNDGRRLLYALAPTVGVVKTPAGALAIDFGCCLLRQ